MNMDAEKLRAIHEFSTSRNKKELHSFISFVNFYRKFTEGHTSNIGPLIELIKPKNVWKFGDEELKLFDILKKAFTEQYLAHFCFDRPFYLQTNASKLGLGAELY